MLLSTNRHSPSLLPAQFKRLQQELQNSLLDFHNGLRATQGALSLNMWSKPGSVIVRLELPGLAADQIGVELKENQVLISTQAPEEDAPEEGKWLQRERNLEAARREIQLPFAIDPEKSEACFGQGILELKLVSLLPTETTKLPVKTKS